MDIAMPYTVSKSGPGTEAQAAPARNAAARRPRTAWLALAAFAVTVNARAQSVIDEPPYAPDSGTLSVRCGALIDGISDAVRRDVIVHIERGRIAAVEPAEADRGRGAGGPELDL